MSKKLLWVLVAVVVLAGVVWWSQQPTGTSSPFSYLNGSPSASATPLVKKKNATAAKSVTTPAIPTANSEYGALVNQYSAAGTLLAFDDICRIAPGRIVIKTGTKVMLDNRSSIAKTIRLDNDSFALPAYNYRVILISPAKTLPYDLGIDCKSASGNSENGGVINVQALISNQIR